MCLKALACYYCDVHLASFDVFGSVVGVKEANSADKEIQSFACDIWGCETW